MRFLGSVAALAVVLVGACDSRGEAPEYPPRGGIQFVWTYAGQPAPRGCADDPAWVTIELTSGPTPIEERGEFFTCGGLVITDLAFGEYVFKATFFDRDTGTAIPQEGVHATVVVDQISMADPIDFRPGQLSAVVSWTVNGGMHCPTGGMVTVTALLSGVPVGLHTIDCSNYRVGAVGLLPGNYTVDVNLESGSMGAMGEMKNVMIPNSANEIGPIDVPCSFCP